jgi:hypothetical protein
VYKQASSSSHETLEAKPATAPAAHEPQEVIASSPLHCRTETGNSARSSSSSSTSEPASPRTPDEAVPSETDVSWCVSEDCDSGAAARARAEAPRLCEPSARPAFATRPSGARSGSEGSRTAAVLEPVDASAILAAYTLRAPRRAARGVAARPPLRIVIPGVSSAHGSSPRR